MRKKYSDPLMFTTMLLTSVEGEGSNHSNVPGSGDDEIIQADRGLMVNDMATAPQEEIIGSEAGAEDALTIVEPPVEPVTEETLSDVLDTVISGDGSAEETEVMP